MNVARSSLTAFLLAIFLLFSVAAHHATAEPVPAACEASSHHCVPQKSETPCCSAGLCVAALAAEEPILLRTVGTTPPRHANAGRPYWPPFYIDRPPKGEAPTGSCLKPMGSTSEH
jgi:hypothetical protein